MAARYGCYLGIDGYGGAFAEAPGHRIGKAMAAEPSPTTAVGVIFYVLPWMGLTPHARSRTSIYRCGYCGFGGAITYLIDAASVFI